MRPFLYLVACAAMLAVSGCAKESNRPVATGKASIRAINSIPGSPQINFLIEQRSLGTIAYKGTSTTAQYDDLSYTFNFKATLAGDSTQTVIASYPLDVVADMDYTFLIGGTLTAPTITLWSEPQKVFTGDENYLSLRIAHTAASLGDVDVYLSPPGTAPVPGQELGTLSYGDYLPPMDVDEGDYVLTYTAAGDPATVLFESGTLTLTSKTSKLLTIFDADENDVAPWAVRIMDLTAGSSNLVADPNYPPTVRFLQASINFPDADIYDTDPLTAPIVTGHTFRDITGDIPMPSGTVPITYTTAGDTSMLLIDDDRDIIDGHPRAVCRGQRRRHRHDHPQPSRSPLHFHAGPAECHQHGLECRRRRHLSRGGRRQHRRCEPRIVFARGRTDADPVPRDREGLRHLRDGTGRKDGDRRTDPVYDATRRRLRRDYLRHDRSVGRRFRVHPAAIAAISCYEAVAASM